MSNYMDMRLKMEYSDYDRHFWNAMRGKAESYGHMDMGRDTATGNYVFTGMVVCGNCGKHYRRKVTKTSPVWICSTFNTMGKAYCPSKQIPENTLISITEETLGSTNALADKITAIRAEKYNILVFCFKDGSKTVKRWQYLYSGFQG